MLRVALTWSLRAAQYSADEGMKVDAPETPSPSDSDEEMPSEDELEDEKPDIEGKLRRKRESPLWRSLVCTARP
jgi:hypothetical protein